MEINFRELEPHTFVSVNGNTVGYIQAEWLGAKRTYQGFIGETRVFIGIRSKKAAQAEMVKHISEIHRKFSKKGSPLDQTKNPLKKVTRTCDWPECEMPVIFDRYCKKHYETGSRIEELLTAQDSK